MQSHLPPYIAHDTMTQPAGFGSLYERLPADVPALRDIVSQLIVHVSWAHKYGIPAEIPRTRDTQSVSRRLQLIQTAFEGSLDAPRPPHRRTFGTCRDYALLLCSMLRHREIATRVRCGFATYFDSSPYEDHWICEYWSAAMRRWCRVDAQIDELLREQLGITLDPANLPDDAYLTAGQAWQLVRSGGASPDDFGQGATRGLWFLQVNLHRDLLSLINHYTSAWDTWRDATARSKVLDTSDIAFADHLATSIDRVEHLENGFSTLHELAASLKRPPWIE